MPKVVKKIAIGDLEKNTASLLHDVKNAVVASGDFLVPKKTETKVCILEGREFSILNLDMVKKESFTYKSSGQNCKTDAEVYDGIYQNQNVYYTATFLTGCGEYSGTKGPFYIQFEGDMGTTSLMSFWPYVGPSGWCQRQFYAKYVGKMTKVRIAPGTSNGWGLYQFMVFYPREKLWFMPNAWIDSDGPNILEISL